MASPISFKQSAFDSCKQNILKKLNNSIDKSPKGSLDEPIRDLINLLNTHNDYVTTSSCSGRISIFQNHHDNINLQENTSLNNIHFNNILNKEEEEEENVNNYDLGGIKKGGKWLLIKHSLVTVEEVMNALKLIQEENKDIVTFKHEPFIMHIQCRGHEEARKLLQIALFYGFRESGVLLGAKKLMLAIRTTSNLLELPIASEGKVLVHEDYIKYLVNFANHKFMENQKKTEKLTIAIKDFFTKTTISSTIDSKETFKVDKYNPCSELERSGHSCVSDEYGRLIIFGGIGKKSNENEKTSVITCRLNTLAIVTYDEMNNFSNVSVPIIKGNKPSNRMHHTATMFGNKMLLFGGRSSPENAFNDLFLLDVDLFEWNTIQTSGIPPKARWSHTATKVGNSLLLVYGGRDAYTVFNDIFLLSNLDNWSSLMTTNPSSTLYAHSAVLLDENKLVVFGGNTNLLGDQCNDMLRILDIDQKIWTTPETTGKLPEASFAHNAVLLDNRFMLLIGGISPKKIEEPLRLIDLQKMEWKTISFFPSKALDNSCLIQHTSILLKEDSTFCNERQILIIGGGAQCFGFGYIFSPIYRLTFLSLKNELSIKNSLTSNERKTITSIGSTKEHTAVVLASKLLVRTLKVELTAVGLYDKSRKIGPLISSHLQKEELYEIPVKQTILELEKLDLNSKLQQLLSNVKIEVTGELHNKKQLISTYSSIKTALVSLLEHLNLDSSLIKGIPLKFEWVGDILMIPNDAFQEEPWQKHLSLLWETIAKAASATRLARKSIIHNGPKRQSQVKLLFNSLPLSSLVSEGWVKVKENGIEYSFDITKVMFSSGNVTEKARMAKIGCEGEVIVDLYAGIGYYVLPFLVHGKARFVHALEWNEDSIYALKENLKLNNVEGRCKVYEGDNRVTGLQLGQIADRINLGLLPSSKEGWKIAVKILKSSGGWMHIHGNVPKDEHTIWVNQTIATFQTLLLEEKRSFNIICSHVERVKSYAPKIDHLVADLHFTSSIS